MESAGRPADSRLWIRKTFRPMKLPSSMKNFLCVAAICLMGTQLMTACAKSNGVPVSVHGVNYTRDEFRYVVEDPGNSTLRAGGETIEPFGAGGTMCCYELPRRWRPGIQVRVNITTWERESPDAPGKEIEKTQLVEVPPYVNGKPGELWVLRNADGTAGLVSSDYQPDHEKWPGRVKGWPVPSLEYQRERWDLHIKLIESEIKAGEQVMTEMEEDPEKSARLTWESWAKYRPQDITDFSGPTDPNFIAKLKRSDTQQMEKSKLKLKQLRESRP